MRITKKGWLALGLFLGLAMTSCKTTSTLKDNYTRLEQRYDSLAHVSVSRDSVAYYRHVADSLASSVKIVERLVIKDSLVYVVDTAGQVIAREAYHSQERDRDQETTRVEKKADVEKKAESHTSVDSLAILRARIDSLEHVKTTEKVVEKKAGGRFWGYFWAVVVGMLFGVIGYFAVNKKLWRYI